MCSAHTFGTDKNNVLSIDGWIISFHSYKNIVNVIKQFPSVPMNEFSLHPTMINKILPHQAMIDELFKSSCCYCEHRNERK